LNYTIFFSIFKITLHASKLNITCAKDSLRLFRDRVSLLAAKWGGWMELLLLDCSKTEEDDEGAQTRPRFRFRLGVRSVADPTWSARERRSSALSAAEPPGTGAPWPGWSLLSSLKLVKMACGECWACGGTKNERNTYFSVFVDSRNLSPYSTQQCGRLLWN